MGLTICQCQTPRRGMEGCLLPEWRMRQRGIERTHAAAHGSHGTIHSPPIIGRLPTTPECIVATLPLHLLELRLEDDIRVERLQATEEGVWVDVWHRARQGRRSAQRCIEREQLFPT